MAQQRNLSLDFIKTIAMLGVICLHTTYQYIQPGTFGLADVLYESAVISIPLFFMVSGYLLLGRENLNYKYAISKIFYIVRFVFFITLSYWILHALITHNFEVKDFLKIFMGSFIQCGSFGIFWYFGAMIIIYSILLLINNLYIRNIISFTILIIGCFLLSTSFFLQNIQSKFLTHNKTEADFNLPASEMVIASYLFSFNICKQFMCEIVANKLISNCSFINDLILVTCYPTVKLFHSFYRLRIFKAVFKTLDFGFVLAYFGIGSFKFSLYFVKIAFYFADVL